MGTANIHPYHLQGSMLVRRIVRLGPKFVCGICRTHHSEVHKANTCLYTCWCSIKSHAPFTAVRKRNLIQYACIYCLRSYQTPSHACDCAFDCSKDVDITEYSISSGGNRRPKVVSPPVIKQTEIDTKPVVVAKQVAPATVVGIAKTATIVAKPAVPETVAQPIPTIGLPPAAETGAETGAEDDKKKLRKAGRTKKFNRAGAKYVCEVCLEKYFTKSEVEKCFEAHPD